MTRHRITFVAHLACTPDSNLQRFLEASAVLEEAAKKLRALGFSDIETSRELVRGHDYLVPLGARS